MFSGSTGGVFGGGNVTQLASPNPIASKPDHQILITSYTPPPLPHCPPCYWIRRAIIIGRTFPGRSGVRVGIPQELDYLVSPPHNSLLFFGPGKLSFLVGCFKGDLWGGLREGGGGSNPQHVEHRKLLIWKYHEVILHLVPMNLQLITYDYIRIWVGGYPTRQFPQSPM